MPTMGVSIAVPDPYGQLLRDRRASFGDEAAATVPSHVTLAPPFELIGDDHAQLTESLLKVAAAHPPFTVQLRGTGSFRPISPVVYVAVTEGSESITQIAESVQSTLSGSDSMFPFHPHVTIAHHLEEQVMDRAFDELADYEADFVVEKFVLYKLEHPVGWVPTMEFPLG